MRARLVQNPAAERQDQAGFLGSERDEAVGHDQPFARHFPAHERFGTDNQTAADIDLRLEENAAIRCLRWRCADDSAQFDARTGVARQILGEK